MDNLYDTTELKSEERLLGLFSHLSLFVGGIFLPIIFWVINKEKSKFVTFHSLQCIFFHLAYIAAIIGIVFLIVFGAMGTTVLFGASKNNPDAIGGVMIVFIVLIYALLFLIIFGAIGYSIYMGIKAYQGKLKKYPIIGNIVYKKVYGND